MYYEDKVKYGKTTDLVLENLNFSPDSNSEAFSVSHCILTLCFMFQAYEIFGNYQASLS